MLGPALIRHQVVAVCQPCETRLLAAAWMVKPLHREEFPRDGVVGLVSEGAGHGHLGVCEHRISARLLVLDPAPDALPVGHPCSLRHVDGEVAEPLPQGKHPQALPLARPVQQGVELGA